MPDDVTQGLFPSVLAAQFFELPHVVRWVHCGETRHLAGTVSVERGSSWVARCLAALVSLPPAMQSAPIKVEIACGEHGERWTRLFRQGHRMQSTLAARSGLLFERLGPARLVFRLAVDNGTLRWRLARVTVAGIPLSRWFNASAQIEELEGRYHFDVEASLARMGRIIRYQGVLHAQ
jgi:Domain of unknown function (DUF4166)